MAERAKILHDGDEQTVRLSQPAQKRGKGWSSEFLATLGALKDVELERPPQRLITEVPNPFDDVDE
jgi:hypothetical protein